MQSSPTSFFRVFDLAFFLPGTVVVGTLAQTRWGASLVDGEIKLESLNGIATGIGLLVAVYLSGLMAHGLSDLIFKRLQPMADGSTDKKWYHTLTPDKREDLALYFWYMRATCRNLVLALVVSAIVWSVGFTKQLTEGKPVAMRWVAAVVTLLLCAVVSFLAAKNYDRALKLATQTDASRLPAAPH
ncbi:MAG TPA: hypothetical protein VN903_18080 [Polyangia bacterium]|jgi:hypothetical protein|nr:hypothetical protein [Polyangia bacterium]